MQNNVLKIKNNSFTSKKYVPKRREGHFRPDPFHCTSPQSVVRESASLAESGPSNDVKGTDMPFS